MLTLGAWYFARCTENESCAFKQMWFDDIPLGLPVDNNSSGLTVTVRSCRKMYGFIAKTRKYLLNSILAKIQLTLILNLQRVNLNLLRKCLRDRSVLQLKVPPANRERKGVLAQRSARPNLSNLPVELRLRIYDYVMHDTILNVVGYRQGKQDAFYFKQRGYCPLMMTCRQFHCEGMDLYFNNLSVTIKAACPSEFTGDMSNFGGQHFKNSLRRVRIADEDESRRRRIVSAFTNAQIELSSRSANGGRKNAYYFC